MMRNVLRAAALISVFVAALVSVASWPAAQSRAGQSFGAGPQSGLPLSELIINAATGEHRFRIELAATPEQMRVGLMYRRELAPDAGMLFDFTPPRLVSMWMKNTYIPLDILFIDETGRIVNIAENTTPHSLASVRSAGPVVAALELNAGVAERLGIAPGDCVVHPLFSAPVPGPAP